MKMNQLQWLTILYIGWIIAHYVASHAYVYFCVPATIRGFVMSPFVVTTTHCIGLRWIIYSGGNKIMSMWILLGLWILDKTTIRHVNPPAMNDT